MDGRSRENHVPSPLFTFLSSCAQNTREKSATANGLLLRRRTTRPMAIDLTSSNAKLSWAEENARAVKKEVATWFDSKPYLIQRCVNPERTQFAFKLRITGEAPLQRWALMVGDCIHNIRCAIDHAVYAIAIHENGMNPPRDEKLIMLPICATPEKFKSGRNKVRCLSNSVRAAIEGFQPYNRPHPDLPPLLGVLNDLDNANKHKFLTLVHSAISRGDFGLEWSGPAPAGSILRLRTNPNPLEDGSEIAAITCERSLPDMKFREDNVFEIIIAIVHGKRDPAGPIGSDRSDVFSVITLLMNEARLVIDSLVSKAIP